MHPPKFVSKFVFPSRSMAAASLLAVITLVAATAIAQEGGDLQYKVAPGDTLLRLAERFMEQPKRYREIARLNQLGDENVLKPGQTVRIPAPYLKMQSDEARVTSVKGTVTLGGAPATVGAKAGAGAGAAADIVTGADGQVTLRLADGSEIRLQNNTSARFTELKRNAVSGARSVSLRLAQGRVETDVTPAKGDLSRFNISTPTAALGVRGTRFRAAADATTASTEVLEGRVAAAVASKSVDVNQGFGSKAEGGRPPLPPVPLLPAPGLTPLAGQVDVESPQLQFAAVPGAARYRALVAEDERFERVVSEAVGNAPVLRTAALRDGAYFFRARAIDPQGLEGFNADGRFTVRATPRAPRVPDPAPRGLLSQPTLAKLALQFRWDAEPAAAGGYLLQVAADAGFTQALTEYKAATAEAAVTVDSSPRRLVYWRVRSLDAGGVPGPAGATQTFEMGLQPR